STTPLPISGNGAPRWASSASKCSRSRAHRVRQSRTSDAGHMEILTPNLKLVLQTPDEVLARIEAMPPAVRAQVSADWLARARAATHPDPWLHGFAVVHAATGVAIGSCAYTGPPSPDSSVEIAYGIDEAHQGRGYATEAA